MTSSVQILRNPTKENLLPRIRNACICVATPLLTEERILSGQAAYEVGQSPCVVEDRQKQDIRVVPVAYTLFVRSSVFKVS